MSELAYVLGLKKARRDLLVSLREEAQAFCQNTSGSPLEFDDAKKLRSAAVIFIAEFFFVLRELDLTRNPDALEAYLLEHNAGIGRKIAKLQQEKLPATASGLTRTRLEDGFIAPEKIAEVVADARAGFFRFDQTTLGALLTELMVKQSTNTHLATLAKTGFLNINGRKPKYITSTGKLETLYEAYLGQLKLVFQ